MPGGISGLFKNTKGAKEHEKNIELMESVVMDFAHYLMDRCENGIIHACEIADYAMDFTGRFEQ